MVVVEPGVHAAELRQAHRDVAVVEDDRDAVALPEVRRDPAEVRHRDGEDEHRVRSLLRDEPVEVAPPARGDDAPDRLAREPVEGAVVGALLDAPEVPVALQPREAAAERGVALALPIGRVRRGPPPRRLDRTAAVRRHDEVGARLVEALPELPPGRRAAVAEVEVDRRGDGEDAGSAHGRSVGTLSALTLAREGLSTRRGR